MRVVVIGHRGQLGTALQEVLAGHDWLGLDLPEYDITELGSLQQALKEFAPEVVIHTAAYTHVDGCARNPDLALRVNALGTQNVALACEAVGAALLYISTNEVFAGDRKAPYLEYDPPNPINPYGYSKWVGERYVAQLCRRFYIVRPSWLFGGAGNFISKILALSQERSELAVVDDEFGAPTYAPDLAAAIGQLMHSDRYGIYHLVNEGWCSRYDFAVESLRLAGKAHFPVRRIKLAEFQRASTPPPRAILRNFCAAEGLGIRLRPWQEAVAAYLQEG